MAVGTQIGAYQIERELGHGGFGVVYVGVDVRLGRRAAIKQLLPELSRSHEIVERFFNEAKAAANINHPGIVEIYDVGWHTDGSAYFAMKLLEGDSLRKRLRATGPLAPALACTIVRQVASALVAAHARGIVHRDLKPDNIILVPDEEVSIGERATVLDFGVAKLVGDVPTMQKTRSGVMLGTPSYMSPEQCRGAGEVDHRTDVYALGCILFEALTGRAPFVGAGPGEVMGMHQFVETPTVRSLRPDVADDLDALVMRMLAKKPEQRIQLMTDVTAALQPFTGARPSSAERARTDGGAPKPSPPPTSPDLLHAAEHVTTERVEPRPPTPRVERLSPTQGEIEPPTVKRRRADRNRMLAMIGGGILIVAIGVALAIATRSSPAIGVDAAVIVQPADAAELAPPTPDAAVVVIEPALDAAADTSDRQKQLQEECLRDQTDKMWPELQTCGTQLAKLDPTAGKAFHERGVKEAEFEAFDRKLDDDLKDGNLKDARRTLAKIDPSSTYHANAEKKFKKAEKDAIDALIADLRAFVAAKDCAGHKKRLQQAETTQGRVIAEAARDRAPCRVQDGHATKTCTPACGSGFTCDAGTCRKLDEGAPPLACDFDALAARGDAAVQLGNHAAAIAMFEQALACKAGSSTLRARLPIKIFLAACNSNNKAKAKQYYPLVNNDNVLQSCLRNGIDPR